MRCHIRCIPETHVSYLGMLRFWGDWNEVWFDYRRRLWCVKLCRNSPKETRRWRKLYMMPPPIAIG